MGVVNTQIQTETTFITAKPEKWLTFFVVVAEIVFICMDTSHVKRKIDSQNFVIFLFFCKIMHFPTLFPGSGSAGLVSANIGAGRNCSQ